MNDQVNYLAVGGFVLGMFAALILLVIWFGADDGDEQTARYRLLFDQDVTGMANGSPVRFMGVQVGRIANIQLTESSPPEVEVLIDISTRVPVTTNTYATLSFQGITGTTFVNLASEGAGGRPLRREDEDDIPMIPTRSTGIAALLNTGPELIGKADELLERATAIFSDENAEKISRALASLGDLADSLSSQREAIAALPADLNATLVEIRQVANSLDSMLNSVEPDVDQLLADLSVTANNLNRLTTRLDGWVESGDGNVQQVLGESLQQVPGLITELEIAVESFEALMESLRRDPSQLIYKPAQSEVPLDG